MKVNLGNSEYSIKFGFKPTLKSHLIKDVSESVSEQDGSLESAEKLLLETLPKMLLVGLQVNHKDEFGYDYDTNEKYDEQFNKVLNLLSEKIDDGEIDCIELFNELENELESNSFLAKMMETEKKNRTPAKKTPSKTTAKN
nr:MAG TPA: tail assembly chaperone protein [Bacteriophage sp.]